MKKLMLLFSLPVISLVLQSPLFPKPVGDLAARDLYVRTGFSTEWINSLPDPDDVAWHRVPGNVTGGRSVKVRDLNIPGIPVRSFFSLKSYPDRIFTFVTSFELGDSDLSLSRLMGMHLAAIGGNWEIYINGNLVHREMHIDHSGSITLWRGMRDVLIPLDPRVLRHGENIAGFRIVGDPTFTDTGFFQSSPYSIDEYSKLLNYNSELLPLVLIFMYMFVGLYHLFLYSNRRQERYNLFYGLFCVAIFAYLFMRTHTVYNIIPDTDVVLRIELISLFTLIPLLGGFFDLILDRGLRAFTLVYGAFCAVLVVLVIPAPRPFTIDILRIWQLAAIAPICYYAFYKIGYRFYSDVRKSYLDAAERGESPAVPGLLFRTLADSVSGNLLIGALVLFTTSLFDIIDAVYLDLDLVLTRYGFFVFIAGSTLVLANRFIYVHGRVRSLNESLERKIEDLNQANRIISLSEEKYRLLIEGTNDGIFTLDDRWVFLSANRALLHELHMDINDLKSMQFQDMVYEAPEEKGVTMRLVRQKLEELASKRKPVSLKLKLKSFMASEPREFHVRLEYIEIEGKNEILGKATSVIEDALLEYFQSERQNYIIGNFLITAEEISHRLVRNLAKYVDTQQANLIRIGLREMIINAIEHGNLNISFDEKSEGTMSDSYMEIVMRRREDPRYRDRRVVIEYSLNADRVAYKIADEGAGFDHRLVNQKTGENANEDMLAHGRGIMMARNIFDEIRFNNKGTQVLLVKRFSGSAAPVPF